MGAFSKFRSIDVFNISTVIHKCNTLMEQELSLSIATASYKHLWLAVQLAYVCHIPGTKKVP